MKSLHHSCAALALMALVTAGCDRNAPQVDREQVREDARRAAEEAKVAAAKAGDTFADSWLSAKIQAQFFADADIRARDIDVTADEGIVTLRGRVQDENAHTQAVQTARNTDGVKQVIDELGIGPDAPVAQGAVATTGAATSEVGARAMALLDDARITSSIRSKFFLDDRVKARRIDVDVRQGVVTLRGEVASEDEKAQALLLARTTDGVTRVEDALSIGALDAKAGTAAIASAPGAATTVPSQVDDASITTKIQAKYFLDRDVKAGALEVTAKDGVVLVDGTVPTQAAKDRALTLARETDGVLQVIDRVNVQRAPARTRR